MNETVMSNQNCARLTVASAVEEARRRGLMFTKFEKRSLANEFKYQLWNPKTHAYINFITFADVQEFFRQLGDVLWLFDQNAFCRNEQTLGEKKEAA